MRKTILGANTDHRRSEPTDQSWLDLEQLASVEVTSEDSRFPIESALRLSGGAGWQASEKGEQQIRIIFEEPQPLHRIQLRFHEPKFERTQEFTVRLLSASGAAREIVRQQWNFSPTGSTTEVEDFAIDGAAVSAVELTIRPDVGRGEAPATLAYCRMR